MSQTIKWSAFESCPNAMNRFLINLGVPKKWRICDILSFDDDIMNFRPGSVRAVLFLFPFSEQDNKYCIEQDDLAKTVTQEISPDLYFMRQTVSNVCGTVALIHAIANNFDQLSKSMKSDALIKKFIDATKSSSPIDKGKQLEHSQEISKALDDSLDRDLGENCDHHFITIVPFNGGLFELDGRKSAPVFHGSTPEKSFLQDAGRVCKEFMARDPNKLNFTALAFCANLEDSD